MKKPAILITERDEPLRRRLKALMMHHGCEVIEASKSTEALQAFHHGHVDLMVLNTCLEVPWDGVELVQHIRQLGSEIALILITAEGSEELAIAALRAKATDYFKQPLSFDDLLASVQRCLADPCGDAFPAARAVPQAGVLATDRMIGNSPALREVKAYIPKVAATDSNVLITGETGTGKELVAELIHRHSARALMPFVWINCAAIPDALLENELFGHERGAFTGAHGRKEGQLKLADGGTVFLDEIGDMSPYAQAKILRAIESRAVYRLGGERSVPLDIRVIAATNQDLDQLMVQERFRRDLYFRLNVVRIHLPPLRRRREDILPLCTYYLYALNHRFRRQVMGFTDEAMACLVHHDWPGNVRELKNLLEAAFVNAPAHQIALVDLPELLHHGVHTPATISLNERERLLSALLATNWNLSKAAHHLHWSRMTVYRKMTKYHIVKGGEAGQESPKLTTD